MLFRAVVSHSIVRQCQFVVTCASRGLLVNQCMMSRVGLQIELQGTLRLRTVLGEGTNQTKAWTTRSDQVP